MTVGKDFPHTDGWVTRYSWPSGHPYRVWEKRVPKRVADHYLECAVYIYPTEEDARAGEMVGGCGFLIAYPLRIQLWHEIYVVTNAHVIRKCGPNVFIRVNTKIGKTEIISLPKQSWTSHPDGDDVSICPIDISFDNYKCSSIGTDTFVTPDMQQLHDIGIGDEVFMVGRFINHEGKQQNYPTLRFGHIAMMPGEPIEDARTGIKQESYLVECRSMGGYSGSPVFVTLGRSNMSRQREMSQFVKDLQFLPPYLLGINWCHIHHPVPVKENRGSETFILTEPPIIEPGGQYTLSNTGMAGVVPTYKLSELLEMEEMREQREKQKREIKKKVRSEGTASLDSADAGDSTFTQPDFEAALKKASRKVVQHPKK